MHMGYNSWGWSFFGLFYIIVMVFAIAVFIYGSILFIKLALRGIKVLDFYIEEIQKKKL